MKKLWPAFLVLSLVFPTVVDAQIVINELSTNTSSDWVELYAFEDIDISGWVLDDYDTKSNLEEFPEGTILGPSTNSFLSVNVGTRLNQLGDIVTLLNANLEEIDKMPYGNKGGVCLPSDTGSVGRVDNGNTIERFAVNTKDASNAGAQLDPCPTPTPPPTSKPTNQPTTKSASTTTKTTTPVSTVLSRSIAKPSTSSKPSSIKEAKKIVLSELEESSSTPIATDESANKNGFPFAALLIIAGGTAFLGGAGYMFFKNRKTQYNGKSEKQKL